MRPGVKLSARRIAIAVAGGVAFAGLVGSVDYLFLGTAKDRSGILGWLFPSPTSYPDLSSEEIRSRLAEHLSRGDSFRKPSGTYSFRVEGCLATMERYFGNEVCAPGGGGWTKSEKFFDLRLVETDPRRVEVRPISHRGYVASAVVVRLRIIDEAAERLRVSADALRARVMREMRRDEASGKYDLRARMDRLRAFQREELDDRLFERLGERVSYCNAGELVSPDESREVWIYTTDERAGDVVDLLHAYSLRECPFDPSVLARD